ncbi:MAG: permease [Sphingobacteriales bacterium UTBCD1]|jgi:lipopolysaccharide export system permease protein|nr:MAG: permease [Sphingobacteriales bacterium UTBCD1]
MRKLDWYILKKFFVTFFFCMFLFTVIAIAVDSSEKTDNFVKSGLTTLQLIKQYYIGFVPWIWSLLFPLFVFISVIFFTSRMAMRSEIIALLASGVTYNRILRPYFIGGIFLAVILWYGNRYFIPRANVIRGNFQAKYVDNSDPTRNMNFTNCYNCYYLRTDSNTFVGLKEFDTTTKTARGFFLDRVKGDKVVYNLRSSLIRWDTAAKGWNLYSAVERKVDSMGEVIHYYDTLAIKLSVKPSELRKDDYLKDKLTTPELISFIKQEEQRGTEGLNTLKVERYRRTATPATVLLLTIIGAIIASRKSRGGSGIHLAIGISMAAFFILSDRFSTVFSTKADFSPLIAAWLPNVAFTFVAYWIYRKTPK